MCEDLFQKNVGLEGNFDLPSNKLMVCYEPFVLWVYSSNYFFLTFLKQKTSCSAAFVFSVIPNIIANFSFLQKCNTRKPQFDDIFVCWCTPQNENEVILVKYNAHCQKHSIHTFVNWSGYSVFGFTGITNN